MNIRNKIAFSAALFILTASFSSCHKDNPLPMYIGDPTVQTGTTVTDFSNKNSTAVKTEKTVTTETTDETPKEPDIEKVSVELPDLSELGIDTDTFPSEGEKFITEIGVGCDIGYKGERPKKTEIICTNEDQNMLIFDENGTLCFYDGPIISFNEAPELTKPDEEYKEMGLKYLKIIEPDFKGYDEDTFDIDRENRRCTMTMKRTYGDDIYDRLKIIFDGDGMVYQFSVNHWGKGVSDTEAPARLRQKVVDYGTDYCEKHFHNGSSVSDIVGDCFEIDGTIYGKYSYIVNSGTAYSPVYSTYQIIVRDE